jgi:uncharacterized protein
MRYTSIDVLRGIAILGILFMNIPFHAHIILGYVPFDPPLTTDQVYSVFTSIFADGRFRTLFCLLFGIGLAIQYESCERKKIDKILFLKTRLHWLLLFGFFHAIFIFGGDILMLYSLSALIVIRKLDINNEAMLKKAKKFIIIGAILSVLIASLTIAFAELEATTVRSSEDFINSMQTWRLDYLQHTLLNAGFSIGMLIISPIFILWQVIGLMYLGVYLYRSGFFENGFEQSVFVKVLILAVVLTIICVSPQVFVDNVGIEVIPLLSSVSAVFVALVYAHIIVRLCKAPGPIMRALVAPGRMAFSLYILQSICMGIILRWLFPDFALSATMLDYFIICLVFTLVQIIVANLYLRKFDQGPLEILWRKAYQNSVDKITKIQAK